MRLRIDPAAAEGKNPQTRTKENEQHLTACATVTPGRGVGACPVRFRLIPSPFVNLRPRFCVEFFRRWIRVGSFCRGMGCRLLGRCSRRIGRRRF